jgi:diguanylate cyclase (GGDEF)-like protein
MKESSLLELPEDNAERLELENDRLRADLAFMQRSLKTAEILVSHYEQTLKLAERDATTDALTGVKNSRGLEKAIEERHPESQENVVVIFADADNFKPVNDTFGHAAGNVVLQEIVGRLQGMVRSTDVVARTGGDEFVVVCFGGDEATLREKFGNGLTFDVDYEGKPLSVGLSVGIAAKLPDEKIEETVRRADGEMYNAKQKRGGAR